MSTVAITSVRLERGEKKEVTGLAGLAHVYTVVAVIECHDAPVQENLVLDDL